MKKIIHKTAGGRMLLLVLLLAFILRVYAIDSNPKSMYGDELTLVYDAYSLLKTGKDQKGESWPLYFSMGGGRPAGYIYATIPFTAIFGPTALAARSVSVLSGIGIVILLFVVSRILLSEKIGLIAAAVSAVIPWELNLSRGGFESHFALFLAMLGLYFFLLAQKKPGFFLVSAAGFALSMQTYSTYVLSTPLFLGILAFFIKGKKFKPSPLFLTALSIVAVSFIFSIYTSISRASKDRVANLLVINQADLQKQISDKVIQERKFSPIGKELVVLPHNKYLEFTNLFFQNYIKNFGLDFLILDGDKAPRHNPASMGQVYLAGLPLIILGIIYLSKNHLKTLNLLAAWLIVAPLPASLVGTPHSIRGSFMLPPLIILMSAGIIFLLNLKGQKVNLFKVLLVVLFLIQLLVFLYRFYFLSPNSNTSFWSYSARIAAETALENKSKYDYIILSASIADMEFAYPVYAKIEPKEVHYQTSHKAFFGEFRFIKYDNVYIGAIPSTRVREVMDSIPGSVLYLGTVQDRGMVDYEGIATDMDGSALFVTSHKN